MFWPCYYYNISICFGDPAPSTQYVPPIYPRLISAIRCSQTLNTTILANSLTTYISLRRRASVSGGTSCCPVPHGSVCVALSLVLGSSQYRGLPTSLRVSRANLDISVSIAISFARCRHQLSHLLRAGLCPWWDPCSLIYPHSQIVVKMTKGPNPKVTSGD